MFRLKPGDAWALAEPLAPEALLRRAELRQMEAPVRPRRPREPVAAHLFQVALLGQGEALVLAARKALAEPQVLAASLLPVASPFPAGSLALAA